MDVGTSLQLPIAHCTLLALLWPDEVVAADDAQQARAGEERFRDDGVLDGQHSSTNEKAQNRANEGGALEESLQAQSKCRPRRRRRKYRLRRQHFR